MARMKMRTCPIVCRAGIPGGSNCFYADPGRTQRLYLRQQTLDRRVTQPSAPVFRTDVTANHDAGDTRYGVDQDECRRSAGDTPTTDLAPGSMVTAGEHVFSILETPFAVTGRKEQSYLPGQGGGRTQVPSWLRGAACDSIVTRRVSLGEPLAQDDSGRLSPNPNEISAC